jgi:hypothetical protein
MTYSGNVSLSSGSNLILTSGISGATNVSLSAAGNLILTGAAVAASGALSLDARGTVVLDNSSVGGSGTTGTSISSAGAINLVNGGSVGNSSAPTTLATGFANINGTVVNGNVTTVIANNLRIAGGGALIASDKVRVAVAKDIMLDSAAGNSSIGAVNAVNLVLASPDSILSLAGSTSGSSTIAVNGPVGSATRVLFSARSSGGVIVDGVPGIGPGGFNSGFQTGRGPATLGNGLFIAYGGVATDICKILPGLCVVRPIGPPGLVGPPPPKPVVKDDTDGIGSFGDPTPATGNARKRPGVCKAA